MIGNRAITLTCLIGGVISVLLSLAYGHPLLAFGGAILFFLSLLIWKYGYLLIPLITRHSRIVEMRDNYEVPPTRDYIVKKTERGYYASKFLEIRFYENTSDKSSTSKRSLFESFERAVLSLRNVVKISLLVSSLDLSKQIDEVKTRRSVAESKRAKLSDKNTDEVVRLDREIAMYNRYLDRFSKGERPLELLSYASTTAFGVTREETLSKLKRQTNEVKTILGSTLGADIIELKDLDMIKCFEWDKFFPSSEEELRESLF